MKHLISKYRFFILLLLTIPLFFLNIREDQSWGDDFAQYVHQAINFVDGKPQFETGYVYNEKYAMLGPKAYTIGFPILLAPIIALFGNNILMLNYSTTFFLALVFIVMCLWLLKYFRWRAAIMLSLICIYNPWMIYFKGELNSEIAFTFFILLFLLIYDRKKLNISNILLLGLIGGFITSIRPIGGMLVISVAVEGVIDYFIRQDKNRNSFMAKCIVIPVIGLAFFFLLNYFLFPVSSGLQAGNQMRTSLFLLDFNLFTKNLGIYFELIQNVFHSSDDSPWRFLSTILSSFFVTLLGIGFIESIKNRISIVEIFVFLYMIVLLFYTYSSAGFRFLMPIAPMLFYYVGLGFVMIKGKLNWNKWTVPISLVTIILVYKQDWPKFRRVENTIQVGPYQTDVLLFFEEIKRDVPNNATILFKKPRALSLYTGKSAFSNNPYCGQEEFKNDLAERKIQYLVVNNDIPNPPLDEFLLNDSSRVQLLKEIGVMRLYLIKK